MKIRKLRLVSQDIVFVQKHKFLRILSRIVSQHFLDNYVDSSFLGSLA